MKPRMTKLERLKKSINHIFGIDIFKMNIHKEILKCQLMKQTIHNVYNDLISTNICMISEYNNISTRVISYISYEKDIQLIFELHPESMTFDTIMTTSDRDPQAVVMTHHIRTYIDVPIDDTDILREVFLQYLRTP